MVRASATSHCCPECYLQLHQLKYSRLFQTNLKSIGLRPSRGPSAKTLSFLLAPPPRLSSILGRPGPGHWTAHVRLEHQPAAPHQHLAAQAAPQNMSSPLPDFLGTTLVAQTAGARNSWRRGYSRRGRPSLQAWAGGLTGPWLVSQHPPASERPV